MVARKPRPPRAGGDEGRNIAESAEPTLLIKNPPRYHALQGGVGFIMVARIPSRRCVGVARDDVAIP